MSTKKTYKVTFKGIIFPGFDKDQVIKNIHNISRIPEHTITRKFFSGKTVVIRHADSQEYANRLQQTFAQAGIETYIAEIYDTNEIEESSACDLDNTNPISNRKNKPEKKVTAKLLYAAIAIAVIAIPAGYVLIAEQEAENETIKVTPLPIETKKEPAEKKIVINSKKEIIKAPNKAPLSLLNTDNIRLLIKISDKAGLKYLSQFIHLTDFNPGIIDIIKLAVQSENNHLIISENKPLYVFHTDHYSGLFISKKNKLSNDLISQIKRKISPEHNKDTCTIRTVQLISTQEHLFISNNNDPIISKKIKSLSNNKNLTKQFLKFDSLFSHIANESPVAFNFYYSDKDKASYLSLSSDNNSFWLNSSPDIIANQLLPHLTIKKNQPEDLSSLKQLSLYQLTLFLITQNKTDIFSADKSQDVNFKPETIITLKKNYSEKGIKNYKNKLDIEFNAQWQSGPFAITTNRFIFAKELTIELLAKGQNIENLMEYSHAAVIKAESVLNNKGKNILLENCADTQVNKAHFKNLNGEQEAYIDNDFVSYTSTSTNHKITLKAGSEISDIEQIKGTITLQLADKILDKTFNHTKLQSSEQQKIKQFNHFSIYFENQDNKSHLTYKVTGDINKFITLRSYNKSGEILDTLLFKKKKIINKQMAVYYHEFSDDIDHIKIFYSNKNKKLTYPFILKPAIIPVAAPLYGQDKAPAAVSIEAGKQNLPEFPSLEDSILQDNPDWLGESKAQTMLLPFYLKLFARNDSDKIHDAVINIKSALSPYISQNLSAVKLTLKDKQNILINDFVQFTINEYIAEEAAVNTDGTIIAPETTAYLNSNTAFEINKDKINELHGKITFNLPTAFKTHSKQYSPSGQAIKAEDLILTLTQIDKHQIQFKIKGDIENLVQLKLYNKQQKLISEPFEFKIINEDTALLTLRYNDRINSVRLILAKETIVKNYTFSLKQL